MASLDGLMVTSSGSESAEFRSFTFATDCAEMHTAFFLRNGWYYIANIDVDIGRRQEGIGKALLMLARDQAYELGATTITSCITSRPCLDAMRSVFGHDAIAVEIETPYGEIKNVVDDHTRADLSYCIPLPQG